MLYFFFFVSLVITVAIVIFVVQFKKVDKDYEAKRELLLDKKIKKSQFPLSSNHFNSPDLEVCLSNKTEKELQQEIKYNKQDKFALIMDYIYPTRMEVTLKKAKQLTGSTGDETLALMLDLVQQNILAPSPSKSGHYIPVISETEWYDLHYSFYENESLKSTTP